MRVRATYRNGGGDLRTLSAGFFVILVEMLAEDDLRGHTKCQGLILKVVVVTVAIQDDQQVGHVALCQLDGLLEVGVLEVGDVQLGSRRVFLHRRQDLVLYHIVQIISLVEEHIKVQLGLRGEAGVLEFGANTIQGDGVLVANQRHVVFG